MSDDQLGRTVLSPNAASAITSPPKVFGKVPGHLGFLKDDRNLGGRKMLHD